MSKSQESPKIPLPKGWTKQVRSAVLHVLSLAQYAAAYTRGWAADSVNARVRMKAGLDQANQEVLLLREEIRIKDARLARIDPHRRPHYPPTERMAILALKATRGWSLEQAARVFHVTAATIASWVKRVDEQGPDALVQLREPVNKFPDFVRFVVQQLKTLCPSLGKCKIAEILARAGLHLGTTTVGRILKEKPAPTPEFTEETDSSDRLVTSKYPNHLWNVDLTVVPTGAGFWCSWLPFTFPQGWPFCWWLAVVVDHHSRRLMGFAVFEEEPRSHRSSSRHCLVHVPRRSASQALMPTLPIVKLEIHGQRSAAVLHADVVLQVHFLVLHASPQTLDHNVVERPPLAVHANRCALALCQEQIVKDPLLNSDVRSQYNPTEIASTCVHSKLAGPTQATIGYRQRHLLIGVGVGAATDQRLLPSIPHGDIRLTGLQKHEAQHSHYRGQ